jgi:SAM-dependent methyltransferase
VAEQSFDVHRYKTDLRRDWDAAAAGWKKWWPVFERAAQHVSDRIADLAGVKPGSRVLDIATGIGEPAITVARRAGTSGRVVAIDQSAGMLAVAGERAAALGLKNVEFRESDAESLAISERDFDAVTCRWGLMFMPDLNAALTRLRDRLAPGGRLATAVWSTSDKVPMISVAADAVRQLAGLPPPPPGALDPLRLADTSILKGALEATGFRDVAIERLNVAYEFESAESFAQFREDVSAPFRALLARQTPEVRQKIADAVKEAARTYAQSDGKIRMNNETILFATHR